MSLPPGRRPPEVVERAAEFASVAVFGAGGEAGAAFSAEHCGVVGGLHRQSEPRLVAEVAAEAEGGLRRQAALGGDDFRDALRGDAQAQRQGGGG